MPSKEGKVEGFKEGLKKDLEEGLEQGLGDADQSGCRSVTGCCADACRENKVRFTHERSGLGFYLTGTPQDDDVTGDVGRELQTWGQDSRASSFFDADAAGNVSFLYEP